MFGGYIEQQDAREVGGGRRSKWRQCSVYILVSGPNVTRLSPSFRQRRPGLAENIAPAARRADIGVAEPQLVVDRSALRLGALQP